MAYRLRSAASALVNVGDLPLGAFTKLSIAGRVRFLGTPVSGDRFIGQWGPAASDEAFLVYLDGSDLAFAVCDAVSLLFGRKSVGANIVSAGQTVGFVVTCLCGSPPTMAFYMNGRLLGSQAGAGTANVTALGNAVTSVCIGREPATPVAGQDADYEGFAIWGEVIPPWLAVKLSAGTISPTQVTANRFLYLPLDERGLSNVWREFGTATATAASRAPRLRAARQPRGFFDVGASRLVARDLVISQSVTRSSYY